MVCCPSGHDASWDMEVTSFWYGNSIDVGYKTMLSGGMWLPCVSVIFLGVILTSPVDGEVGDVWVEHVWTCAKFS